MITLRIAGNSDRIMAKTISSRASIEEGSTTIREDGVLPNGRKYRGSYKDCDIVWSTQKCVAVSN